MTKEVLEVPNSNFLNCDTAPPTDASICKMDSWDSWQNTSQWLKHIVQQPTQNHWHQLVQHVLTQTRNETQIWEKQCPETKHHKNCESCLLQVTWKIKFQCQICLSWLFFLTVLSVLWVLVVLSVLMTMMTMMSMTTMIIITMTTMTTNFALSLSGNKELYKK